MQLISFIPEHKENGRTSRLLSPNSGNQRTAKSRGDLQKRGKDNFFKNPVLKYSTQVEFPGKVQQVVGVNSRVSW